MKNVAGEQGRNVSPFPLSFYYIAVIGKMLLEYGLILLRAKIKKKFIEWFLIPAQFKNFRGNFW